MALRDSFSRRQKALRGNVVDVYEYEELPQHLRVQISYLFEDVNNLISRSNRNNRNYFEMLKRDLCKDFGVRKLVSGFYETPLKEISEWIIIETNVDRILDSAELVFSSFRRHCSDFYQVEAQAIITEFNDRFLDAGVGYQFANNIIIKLDNEFLHKEVIIPTLNLLQEKRFETASDEFHEAHTAYRHKDYQKCLGECLKAFESVLKIIGNKHTWDIKEGDTAKGLISAAFSHQFIPNYMQAEFNGLRTLLESSIPPIRNKSAAHGAGIQQRIIPKSLAALQINQTATIIRFLIDVDNELTSTL